MIKDYVVAIPHIYLKSNLLGSKVSRKKERKKESTMMHGPIWSDEDNIVIFIMLTSRVD